MRLVKFLFSFWVVMLLAACGGGGGSPGIPTNGCGNQCPTTALFTIAPEALTLAPGEGQSFAIGGGVPPYTGVSDNTAVAMAGISNTSITLGAVSPGVAGITLRDSVGAKIKIGVTVSSPAAKVFYTTAPSDITVGVGSGAAQTYSVSGGSQPYSATSSNTLVATVALSGSELTVTGVAPGSAKVILRDGAGATINISVTVTSASLPLFTTAPSSLTMAVDTTQTFVVGGGIGPYSVNASDTAVVKVGVVGKDLTIGAAAAGTSSVVVRDSVGAVVNISLAVTQKPLSLTPSAATGIIGDQLVATILGGKAPYRASVGNPLVTSASIVGDQLVMQLKQTGQTVVTVLDANNQSAAHSVTSNAATPGIRLSPSSLRVSENEQQPISLSIYGATGSVAAFSSNTRLLNTFVSGNRVQVTAGSDGSRCVAAETAVTITIVDSTGASAISVITIEDNGACP